MASAKRRRSSRRKNNNNGDDEDVARSVRPRLDMPGEEALVGSAWINPKQCPDGLIYDVWELIVRAHVGVALEIGRGAACLAMIRWSLVCKTTYCIFHHNQEETWTHDFRRYTTALALCHVPSKMWWARDHPWFRDDSEGERVLLCELEEEERITNRGALNKYPLFRYMLAYCVRANLPAAFVALLRVLKPWISYDLSNQRQVDYHIIAFVCVMDVIVKMEEETDEGRIEVWWLDYVKDTLGLDIFDLRCSPFTQMTQLLFTCRAILSVHILWHIHQTWMIPYDGFAPLQVFGSPPLVAMAMTARLTDISDSEKRRRVEEALTEWSHAHLI